MDSLRANVSRDVPKSERERERADGGGSSQRMRGWRFFVAAASCNLCASHMEPGVVSFLLSLVAPRPRPPTQFSILSLRLHLRLHLSRCLSLSSLVSRWQTTFLLCFRIYGFSLVLHSSVGQEGGAGGWGCCCGAVKAATSSSSSLSCQKGNDLLN